MIKNSGSKFDDYSISPKIRQMLLHLGYELIEKDFELSNWYIIIQWNIDRRVLEIKIKVLKKYCKWESEMKMRNENEKWEWEWEWE